MNNILFGLWALMVVAPTMVHSGLGSPPKMMEDIETHFRIPAGQTVFRLTCPVISELSGRHIIVDWKKDGEQIDSDNRVKLSKDNRELRIKKVRMEDSGRYTCQATNGFGHKSLDFTVHVYEGNNTESPIQNKLLLANKPSTPSWLIDIESEPSTIRVFQKERLELRCPAQGNPLPQIRWYKSNYLIRMSISADEATYVIDSASKTDNGNYRCVLENEHGRIENVVRVIVEDNIFSQKKYSDTYKYILEISENVTVEEGESADFYCKASPSVSLIRWIHEIKNDPEYIFENQNSTYTTSGGYNVEVVEARHNQFERAHTDNQQHVITNNLYISPVARRNAGRYLCVTTTKDGRIYYKTTYLHVLPKNDKEDVNWNTLYIITAAPFLVLVCCAVLYLRRDQKPSSPRMHKPPPPPCIPPPLAPVSGTPDYYRKQDDNRVRLVSQLSKHPRYMPSDYCSLHGSSEDRIFVDSRDENDFTYSRSPQTYWDSPLSPEFIAEIRRQYPHHVALSKYYAMKKAGVFDRANNVTKDESTGSPAQR